METEARGGAITPTRNDTKSGQQDRDLDWWQVEEHNTTERARNCCDERRYYHIYGTMVVLEYRDILTHK